MVLVVVDDVYETAGFLFRSPLFVEYIVVILLL